MDSAPWPPAPRGIAGRDGPKQPLPRWLLGCLAALVLVAVVAGLVGLAAAVWFFIPPEQVHTLAVIGPEATGALHFRDDPEHEGLNAFLDVVGEEIGELDRARKRGRLPEDMRWMQGLSGGRATDADGLRAALLPSDATVVHEASTGGTLAAGNPSGMVRMYRALLVGLSPEGKARSHAGAELVSLGGAWVAFRGGTIVWSKDEPMLLAALDRVAAAERIGLSPLAGELAPLAGRWHLSGVLALPTGELLSELDRALAVVAAVAVADRAPELPELPAEVGGDALVSLGLEVASADRLVGEVSWACDDPAGAEALRARLARDLGALGALAGARGVTLTSREEPGTFRLELAGVEQAVRAAFRALAESLEVRR